MGACVVTRSAWGACGAEQRMGARAPTRSARGARQRMGAHAASLDVGCMRRVEACACDVPREKDREREREHGACILHGTELRMFRAFGCMFHLDVACVSSICYICCTCMLQVYASNVLSILDVCCKCFI
jgi:hypothetical protein